MVGMTSSSEEDASGGVEGRDGLSESVMYPRFLLVGMTSSSDLSSSLTGAGAGAGAGNASGTRSRSAAASSFDHLVSKAPTVRPVPSRSAIRLADRAGSVNKCKAQDSFARRRPSLVAGVCRSAQRAPERCDVEGKKQIDDAELAARPQRSN